MPGIDYRAAKTDAPKGRFSALNDQLTYAIQIHQQQMAAQQEQQAKMQQMAVGHQYGMEEIGAQNQGHLTNTLIGAGYQPDPSTIPAGMKPPAPIQPPGAAPAGTQWLESYDSSGKKSWRQANKPPVKPSVTPQMVGAYQKNLGIMDKVAGMFGIQTHAMKQYKGALGKMQPDVASDEEDSTDEYPVGYKVTKAGVHYTYLGNDQWQEE